jgi:DNA mismatch repair protein MutS
MTPSILYRHGAGEPTAPLQDRQFAIDLNLDQVFGPVCEGREQLDLLSLFYSPLRDVDSVAYRHEVIADFEHPPVLAAVRSFGQGMRQVRDVLATMRSLHNRWQQRRLFVDAVSAYCDAVTSLTNELVQLEPASRGLSAFTIYLSAYQRSAGFSALVDEARTVLSALGKIRYTLHIRGTRVTVGGYSGEPDYAREVETIFAKFREAPASEFLATFRNTIDMDRVEGQVLDRVARLYPRPFGALNQYFEAHHDFLDLTVAAFDRDSQFYIAYLDHIAPLRSNGLAFCYPHLSISPDSTRAKAVFDLALADKVNQPGSSRPNIVTNDFELGPDERIVVVTGPNSGGKTTFARAVGQVHYLASLGLLVPAEEAELVLADAVYTSFGQEEQLGTPRSHLEDELVHLHEVISLASPRSVIVLNESFSSTTLRDASRSSNASRDPVDVPDGTPAWTVKSSFAVKLTARVGLPHESRISIACTSLTVKAIATPWFVRSPRCGYCRPHGPRSPHWRTFGHAPRNPARRASPRVAGLCGGAGTGTRGASRPKVRFGSSLRYCVDADDVPLDRTVVSSLVVDGVERSTEQVLIYLRGPLIGTGRDSDRREDGPGSSNGSGVAVQSRQAGQSTARCVPTPPRRPRTTLVPAPPSVAPARGSVPK